MNPFEQLRLLSAIDAPQVFEDAAIDILRESVGKMRRVRLWRGDGGVDGFTGNYGPDGKVEVYQVKYFPDPLTDSRKSEIRESYRTALESKDFNLETWFLCLPSRLHKEDLRWFDQWKVKQETPCELIDGDDLERMLAEESCGHVRRRLTGVGVRGLASDGPRFEAVVAIQPPSKDSGLSAVVYVWIENVGSKTAHGSSVEVRYSETGCVAYRHVEEEWDNAASDGRLNPRHLRSKRGINPGKRVPVVGLPICARTPFPFCVGVKIWAEDMASVSLVAEIASTNVIPETYLALSPGEWTEPVREESTPSKHQPTGESAKTLLAQILENPDPEKRGVGEILDTKITGPLVTPYICSLRVSGRPLAMRKTEFKAGIGELITLGWLAPGEKDGRHVIYEYLG